MKFSDLKTSILAQFSAPDGFKVVPFIVGKPGGGKSSCAREIAEALAESKGIPAERIVEFNPSLREPSDILGLPDLAGEFTRWVPPQELWTIRAGQGPSILIIEELSDAQMDMQNPLCRVILDRAAGQMALSEELFIIATGNRTEDRSGASRLSTKLANRMRILQFDEDLDNWLDWAAEHSISPMLRAFLRFRPNLLSDFEPSRTLNPTPRAWEDVSRIPENLAPNLFMEHVKGAVGEGAAAEYMGFRQVFDDLPDMRELLKHPDTVEIPTGKPSVLYAVVGKLLTMATKTNFGAMAAFIKRLPPEFEVMFMREAIKSFRWACRTPEFAAFSQRSIDLLV